MVQEATIQTVKEFGIYNVSKYIRTKTNIDRSSDQIADLNSKRNPNFHEELFFLKVLIEGQASLYIYIDGNLTRFFYKKNNSEINQLVYKRYLVGDKISKNEYFKQQIFLHLKCEGIGLNDIEQLSYSKKNLEKLFIKYNECANSNFTNFEPKQKKDLFNLNIRPFINYSSLKIQNSMSNNRDTDFGNRFAIRLGIETEFILPYYKNKWSIIIEPTIQYYKSELSKETSNAVGGILVTKIDYKSIDLPVGARHYFYINDKSKLFTNISYVLDLSKNSSVKFLRNDNSILSELEIKSKGNLALGMGYKYKDRYSLEIRYNTNRKILNYYLDWNSYYSSLNIIFGLSLF